MLRIKFMRWCLLPGALLFGIGVADTSPNPSDTKAWLNQQNLQDLGGTVVSLTEPLERGQSLVLVFWTPWCGNCAKEAPILVETAARLQGKAAFVGIVPGSDESIQERKVKRFITKHQLNYPTLRDRELALTKGLQVQGTPTIVVIDPSMNILYHGHTPPESWDDILSLP